jgi:hypothetical protein
MVFWMIHESHYHLNFGNIRCVVIFGYFLALLFQSFASFVLLK